jgi:hypothetical protein
VRLLRKLANSGQAILCTIHQPSSVLFEQFDRLLLLQKGGRTVYFGNIGESSREVIAYFEAHNSPICQPEENPAEYILNVIGAGATAKKSQNFGDVWAQSEDAKRMVEDILRFKTEYKDSTNPGGDEGSDLTFAVPWVTQYKAVQMRVFQNYWRDPSYVNAKMLLNIVAGLFLGFTYWMSPNSVQGMQNKVRSPSFRTSFGFDSDCLVIRDVHGFYHGYVSHEPAPTPLGGPLLAVLCPGEAIQNVPLVNICPF